MQMRSLFTFLIILPFICIGQFQKDININWVSSNNISLANPLSSYPLFEGNAFEYDSFNQLVYLNLLLAEPLNYSNAQVSLNNAVYESINLNNYISINKSLIPNACNPKIVNHTSGRQKQSFLKLSPIIKDNDGYKKLISFSYSIINLNASSKSQITKRTASGITNSVLATGDWYRFYVEKSGVYRINKSFLERLGIRTSAVDPKKIHIYGNGGAMLPLSNGTDCPIDLEENAITVIGESDGVFDNQDYILFYAQGIENWNEESQTHINLYDTKSYYYITINSTDGKRIVEHTQPSGTASTTINTFDDEQFHEIDKYNVEGLGRQWLGEYFEVEPEQTFDFNFPNIVMGSNVSCKILAASGSPLATRFSVTANNVSVGDILFSAITNSFLYKYYNGITTSSTIAAAENISIKLTYNNSGNPLSIGYLDYIKLTATRNLIGYGKQFHFKNNQAATLSGIGNYSLGNASSIAEVWDITDIYNPTKYTNNGLSTFEFKANLGISKSYIAIDSIDFYTPSIGNQIKISNQDIKGTIFQNSAGQFEDIDYLIITREFLKSYAEDLADFHRTNSNLTVKVLSLESIFEEFGSGKQDIAAIRNCIKYVYENASSIAKRIKYVNLFGDTSYDYKDRIRNNTNIVPIYHSTISNTLLESAYASDDFYGYMDDNEGNIGTTFGGIDIAVGRMLINNASQAQEMVNKVKEYYASNSYGNWRNNITMVADDSDTTSDASLQARQNALTDNSSSTNEFINFTKILLDSYQQEASSGGNRYPTARADLFEGFEQGELIINYLGHGGEDGLSSERIWEKSDGQNLTNQYKYPLFITITCEFSRFDDPDRPTAGEYTYWNPSGGAIGLLSTVREIYQNPAQNFNDILFETLITETKDNDVSIGEALRLAKNIYPNSSSNVVLCIGDPAIRLAVPKNRIELTKVNDQPITGAIDDFKALSKIKISGQVVDESGSVDTNYNGELFAKIFDKNISRTTLNNDGNSPSIGFTTLGEAIFRGNASVINGEFEFSFIVPKDIKTFLDNGKISFYSKKNNANIDYTGSNTLIKVGGVNENPDTDNINPVVKLYMNDQSFVSGGITNTSPYIYAEMLDASGINTASGIGHDITAVIDGDVSNTYVLNDYYETNLDDYTQGKVRYPLRDLAPGLHTLTLKAWDVYNNPTVTEITFLVVEDESITLTNVLNYPNPFVNYTEFWFTHNRPYENLEAQVQVYTITGKLVWTKNQIISTQGFLSRDITWNGTDDFGNKIGKGTYIYKLTVKSNVTNNKSVKIEKLVIL